MHATITGHAAAEVKEALAGIDLERAMAETRVHGYSGGPSGRSESKKRLSLGKV
jgi:hypothetical protein